MGGSPRDRLADAVTGPPTYSDVFWTIGEGYLLNNFLPFRLGELRRAFLLSRKSGMQFMEILPTIVIERVDLGFNAAIFLAALPFVVGAKVPEYWHHCGDCRRPWAGSSLRAGAITSGRWISFIKLVHAGLPCSVWRKLSRVLLCRLECIERWLAVRPLLFWMALNWGIAIFSYYLIIRAFFRRRSCLGDVRVGGAAFGGAACLAGGWHVRGGFGGAVALLTAMNPGHWRWH